MLASVAPFMQRGVRDVQDLFSEACRLHCICSSFFLLFVFIFFRCGCLFFCFFFLPFL